jgi:hypothetical protein
MKKLLVLLLAVLSINSAYAQNPVYGTYIKAIDSLAVGSGVTSDGGSLTVDNLTLDGSTITSSGADLNVNANILPVSSLSDNLGSALKEWNTLFLSNEAYIDNIRINDNTISSFNSGGLTFSTIGNENINITAGGTGGVVIDNLTLNGNDITTATNTDLTLAPNGTGILDVESNVSLSDNALLDVGSSTTSGSFYEEGTFTPTVKGSSAAGTATYSIQIGRFSKIGNRVFFNLQVAWSAGNGTGSLRVDMSGISHTSLNDANYFSACAIEIRNVTLTASNIASAVVAPNSTDVYIDETPVAGGAANAVTYDAAGTLLISGHYEVN